MQRRSIFFSKPQRRIAKKNRIPLGVYFLSSHRRKFQKFWRPFCNIFLFFFILFITSTVFWSLRFFKSKISLSKLLATWISILGEMVSETFSTSYDPLEIALCKISFWFVATINLFIGSPIFLLNIQHKHPQNFQLELKNLLVHFFFQLKNNYKNSIHFEQ